MKPRGAFPETEQGWADYNKQYDVEAGEFVEELGNNGEELKDYPDEDYGCNIQHEKAERDCGAR